MTGKREVRTGGTRRWVITGVAVSALALAVPAGAAFGSTATTTPSAQCEVEELELPSGDQNVAVVGGDPTGRYIVNSGGLFWTDGEVEVLTGPEDNPEYPVDLETVNSSGVVVGNTTRGNDSTDPWTYQAGTYTDLRNEGAGDWANDINATGDVVGFAWGGSNFIPQIWPVDGYDSPQPIAASDRSYAAAISDSGGMVGYEVESGKNKPTYWPDANTEGRRLELPAGVEGSYPTDIAGDWAVSWDGLRWNLSDGSVEELPSNLDTVNGEGDAAGTGGTIYRADGSTVELPAPDGEVGPVEVAVVFDPGADHTAAGSYEKADGTHRPVVWSC